MKGKIVKTHKNGHVEVIEVDLSEKKTRKPTKKKDTESEE